MHALVQGGDKSATGKAKNATGAILKFFWFLVFHWSSFHTRLRSNHKAWCYKKKMKKEWKYIRKLSRKNTKIKSTCKR